MAETPLDLAHAAMEAGGDAERLRFYDRLAEAELFLVLAREAEGDRVEPEIFETEEGAFVLAFDTEERLGDFIGRPAPYAALSGRALAAMLAGQGIGVALNPEVAPSATLVPAGAVDWLAEILAQGPGEVDAQLQEVLPPADVPEALLNALDAKLATAAGLARMAYMVRATYAGKGAAGGTGHLLAFVDAQPGAEPALARAVSEAVTFSGLDAAALDVMFARASDPLTARLARVGLRIDLPEPDAPPSPAGAAPGMDPDNPPRLR